MGNCPPRKAGASKNTANATENNRMYLDSRDISHRRFFISGFHKAYPQTTLSIKHFHKFS
jgi:hypothetical protein